jgi:hypothetical protein
VDADADLDPTAVERRERLTDRVRRADSCRERVEEPSPALSTS